MSVLQSVLKLSVIDGVSSKMRSITGSMNGLMKQSNSVMAPINGTVMRVAGLAAGYVGVREGLRGTVGAAMGFESAFADVRKVIDGTDNQLNTLRSDILALSKEMPVSAEGFAQIYAAAGQSNIPIQEIKKFSKTVAEVSTAWEVPVAETGKALAEIKNQLQMNVGEISLYADAVNHLSNNTAARAPDLVDYSKRVAATGEMYGFAATETLAFGSAMIASGAQSEVAATSYRNMGRALTIGERATKSHREAYKSLGLDSVKVAKSMQKNAVKTTLDVLERIKKLPEWQQISVAGALFGDEARALMPVINNSSDLRKQLDMVGDAANYAGSAFEEYRIRAQTTENTLDKVKNNFTALGIGIGDRFLPAINSGLNGVLDVFATLDQRSGFFEEFNIGMKGFMNGLGFKDAREMINSLAGLMMGPVLDAKGMSDTGESLGRLFMDMKGWGESLREFSIAVQENPITGFFADMAGQGFKAMLLAGGVLVLSKAVFRLSSALLSLMGVKLGWKILKGGLSLFKKVPSSTAASGIPARPSMTETALKSGKPGSVGPWGKVPFESTLPAGTKVGPSGVQGLGTAFKSSPPAASAWLSALKSTVGGIVKGGALWASQIAGEAAINDGFRAMGYNPKRLPSLGENISDLWGYFANGEDLAASTRDRIAPHRDDASSLSDILSYLPDKSFWLGRAADPNFNFREHMAIKTRAGSTSTEQQVSLTAPTIADLNRPSGTQDVRVINPSAPPNITNNITVHATTQADPNVLAELVAQKSGDATKAVMDAMFSDAATD